MAIHATVGDIDVASHDYRPGLSMSSTCFRAKEGAHQHDRSLGLQAENPTPQFWAEVWQRSSSLGRGMLILPWDCERSSRRPAQRRATGWRRRAGEDQASLSSVRLVTSGSEQPKVAELATQVAG